MKNPKIEVFGITDAGTVKEINEDSFVYKVVNIGENMAGIFAVADGVGGLQKGDIASATAISILNKWWEEVFKNNYKDRDYLVKSLIRIPEIINTELLDMINKDGIKMATTLSVMLIYKKEAFVVNVGDSRIYKVQKGLFKPSIRQLTQDHSTFVNREVDGKIFRKSVLTECLWNK
jgi:protein phosphatase